MVSFDEVYNNLAGEGEVSPDVRRELSRIDDVVPGANPLTRRVAEVLYLIREIAFVPRTIDNIARLLVEHTTDDLMTIIGRIKPELDKLIAAKLVAPIGEEYEFLTGERRTFEARSSRRPPTSAGRTSKPAWRFLPQPTTSGSRPFRSRISNSRSESTSMGRKSQRTEPSRYASPRRCPPWREPRSPISRTRAYSPRMRKPCSCFATERRASIKS